MQRRTPSVSTQLLTWHGQDVRQSTVQQMVSAFAFAALATAVATAAARVAIATQPTTMDKLAPPIGQQRAESHKPQGAKQSTRTKTPQQHRPPPIIPTTTSPSSILSSTPSLPPFHPPTFPSSDWPFPEPSRGILSSFAFARVCGRTQRRLRLHSFVRSRLLRCVALRGVALRCFLR